MAAIIFRPFTLLAALALVIQFAAADVPLFVYNTTDSFLFGIAFKSDGTFFVGGKDSVSGNFFLSLFASDFTRINQWPMDWTLYGLTLDSNGDVIIATYNEQTVIRVSGTNGTVLAVYRVGMNSPADVAVASYIYVANQYNSSVTKLTRQGAFIDSYPLGPKQFYFINSICADRNEDLWLASALGDIIKMSNTGSIVAVYKESESYLFAARINAAGDLFTTEVDDSLNGRILQIDTRSGQVKRFYNSSTVEMSNLRAIAFHPHTGDMYLTEITPRIFVFATYKSGDNDTRTNADERITEHTLLLSNA